MADLHGKRITLKRSRPNPLFQGWLEDLHKEAKKKKSKLEPILQQALDSISKYPLPLETGAECAILNGFDKQLCLFLDKRLEVYKTFVDTTPNVPAQNLVDTGQILRNSVDVNKNTDLKSYAGTDQQNSCSINNSDELKNSITSLTSDNVRKNINLDSEDVQKNLSPLNSDNVQKNISLRNDNAKRSRSKQYKPDYKTGGFAILLGLLEFVHDGKSTPIRKEQLIERAQIYSEESFTRPKPDTFYTAWSNMTTLLRKGLVIKSKNRNTTFHLSEEGKILARELFVEYNTRPTTSHIIFKDNNLLIAQESKIEGENNERVSKNINILCNGRETDSSGSIETNNEKCLEKPVEKNNIMLIDMEVGSFDVILLIDIHETNGLNSKNDPMSAQFRKYPHLKHEYRSLKVGDFTWIARHKVNKDQELVLPYIVERKRMDDLGASIKDGRFHEQKFRLRKCGLDNVIYLVEKYGSNKHVGLPIQSLMQALANTRVQDKFKVHMTDSLTNSVRFLAMMTKRLETQYEGHHLKGCNKEQQNNLLMTFEYFNKSALKSKPLTVTDTFIKLLLQLKGVSIEKALAITSMYKTPSLLIKAYETCSKKEGEMLLANLKYSAVSRNVGLSVSKTLYQLFTVEDIS